MADLLAAHGMHTAAEGEDADVVVLNSCHIREKAAEKIYSDIGRLRKQDKARTDGGRSTIIVAGCVAQAEGEEMAHRTRDIDAIVGPQAYHRLPEMLAKIDTPHSARRGGARMIDLDMPTESKFDQLPARRGNGRASAFLTVQEGCDKFCTYCVVPYTRGAEVSRPFAALMSEAQNLIAVGVREITLLGQNVNAWRGEDSRGRVIGLDGLIRALADYDGLLRIRYTTSHPTDMSDGLIVAHGEVAKLMPFLHLPIQSGSDRILKAMNRSHTVESYAKIIARVRATRPDIAISGDFIVGFPGESEADFEATLNIVRHINYAQSYSFKYSRRPGTPAADSKEQVSRTIMDDRLQRLQALLNQQQLAFNEATIGKRLRLLIERDGKYDRQWIGRSPWMQSVHVTAPQLAIGDERDVRITSAGPKSLSGEIVGDLRL